MQPFHLASKQVDAALLGLTDELCLGERPQLPEREWEVEQVRGGTHA